MKAAAMTGEVIVVDNDSSDDSDRLALQAGARVIKQPVRGYGAALLAGCAAARGEYIVMADADGTYDMAEIPRFVEALHEAADLVVGDRMDGIAPGAMPWLHRHIGNPLLSRLLNLLFATNVRDAHCGMRAFRRDVLDRLELQATGMELASEMIIRAARVGLAVGQLPIAYAPRSGTSKLSPFSDGWRHLRLLLLYAPFHLFMVPGAVLTVLGVIVAGVVLTQVEVFGRQWFLHTLVAGSLLTVAGVQLLSLGACGHAYAVYYLGERSHVFNRLRGRFRLEHGLGLGAVVILAGVVMAVGVATTWAERGFTGLSEEQLAVVAATVIIIGLQILFASFLLSVIGLRRQRVLRSGYEITSSQS
jgi:glycosyltransferase involved in cell wall biosynthesis